MNCIVVHAADVSGSDKERKRKTDKVDAVKLARYQAAGLLQAIYIPDEELQKQRNLVRFRCKLTRDNSGETQYDRGISSRRYNQLRVNLIQAAWQAIRTDPAMLETYQQLIKRMKGTQAIVRIARTLVRRIRAIQLNATLYQKGVVE